MSGVNKAILIGNLGRDPEVRTFANGGKVCNLAIATSESWRDKNTGERKEKTEWHRVVVFNEGLVKVCESYLKKGSKIYIEGQIQTREWEKDGQKNYTTEIVLRGFQATLVMLNERGDSGSRSSSSSSDDSGSSSTSSRAASRPTSAEIDDDIPF